MTFKHSLLFLSGFLLINDIPAAVAVKTDIPKIESKKAVSKITDNKETQAKKVASKKTVKEPEKKSLKKTATKTDVQNAETKKATSEKKALKLVNKIATVVYTDDEPIIITLHDYTRKSLDGVQRTRQQVLLERLLYHEALNVYRMPVPDEMVDKHLGSIREAHGISDNEIGKLFMREGYTFEEGKEQLRMSYAIQNLVNSLVTSRLVVTEQEIQDFYKKNPIIEPAAFRIQKGFIVKDSLTEKQLKDLQEDGQHQEVIEWGHPYWLELGEIADAKKFIIKMEPGQLKTLKDDEGHEVIKLIKRKKEHKKTLDECRRHIADQLKMPKYEKMMKELEQDLLKKYDIVELD